jgi:predicted RNA binding protein YcfA (HicA-like mRNA interferase family)
MPQLPVLNGRKVQRAFERLGWVKARQTGSHIIMTKDGEMVSLSIPNHNPVAKGTLRSLIRSAGLTVDEFAKACD